MSHQNGQQGYGQYNPYGQSGNPYAEQEDSYTDRGNNYGRDQYGGRPQPQPQGSSYYDQDVERRAGGYEMSNINGNDPNRLLNNVRSIDQALDELDGTLDRLGLMHGRAVNATKQGDIQVEVDRLSKDVMKTYKEMTLRVRELKSDPESGNPRNAPQIGKVDRRLKTLISKFQQLDRRYRQNQYDMAARDIRTVNPDASDAEVRETFEQGGQIFSQALMNSDRRGQVASTAQNVQARHEAIRKIEQDMQEIAQLYQDLDAAVLQQEPAVAQIEQRGEEVTEHVAKANVELTGAVDKARAARRKKFWCLGIVVLIVIIIAVVVAVAVTVTNNN